MDLSFIFITLVHFSAIHFITLPVILLSKPIKLTSILFDSPIFKTQICVSVAYRIMTAAAGIMLATAKLIMSRFEEIGKDLVALRSMSPADVEIAFYPPENIRRKEESVFYVAEVQTGASIRISVHTILSLLQHIC